MATTSIHTINAKLTNNFTNPEYTAEYDRLESEFAVVDAMIQARKQAGLTQKDLATLMQKPQSTIARLESGTHNPKISSLNAVAKALGKELKISFV